MAKEQTQPHQLKENILKIHLGMMMNIREYPKRSLQKENSVPTNPKDNFKGFVFDLLRFSAIYL